MVGMSSTPLLTLLLRALQVRTDGVAMAFFALSVIIFMYVDYGSCASYLQSWLGDLPSSYTIHPLVSIYQRLPVSPQQQGLEWPTRATTPVFAAAGFLPMILVASGVQAGACNWLLSLTALVYCCAPYPSYACCGRPWLALPIQPLLRPWAS